MYETNMAPAATVAVAVTVAGVTLSEVVGAVIVTTLVAIGVVRYAPRLRRRR